MGLGQRPADGTLSGTLVLALVCLLPALAMPDRAAAATTRLPVSEFGLFQRPEGLAVDPANGDIYVIDIGADSIRRFDSSFAPKPFTALGEELLDGAGGGACPVIAGDCDQTPQNGFSFDGPGAAQVAIDRSGSLLTDGNVYVTDSSRHRVDVFAPTGKYLGQLSGFGSERFGEACGVTVEPSGVVDVSDFSHEAVYRFQPSANPPLDSDAIGRLESTEPCELASGPDGSLFVAPRFGQISKLDSLGTALYQLGPFPARGLATEAGGGNLLTASGGTAYEYDVSGDDEARLVSSFGAERFKSAGGVAAAPDGSRAYVSDPSSGRVQVFGPAVPAPAPGATLAPYQPMSATAAVLVGFVNPHGTQTAYHFEYGLRDCAIASCQKLPVGEEAAAGSGADPVRVRQEVTGLQPGATYRYRLVAGNEGGTGGSEWGTFSALEQFLDKSCPNQDIRRRQHAELLPDCRAYERVSTLDPATRNGADVLLDSQFARSASDGNAFEFSSTTGAGDVLGLPLATDYLARRRPGEGWTVHGITPPQRAISSFELNSGRVPRYLGEFSPDLSKGVFLSNSALSAEGENVRGMLNLYLREDLLSAGPGSYRLLSDAFAPVEFDRLYAPVPAGSSADLSHVLFESTLDLTPEAASLEAGPRLYEWVDGEVRMVAVLPADEGGEPTPAQAGRGASLGNYTTHVISEDGSRLVFTTPPFEQFGAGAGLYLRDDRRAGSADDDTVVRVNRSERADEDPRGPRPATFWTATPDLSQIFFTTSEALTDDASTESPGSAKLYRYNAAAAAGERLTLLSVDRNREDGITDGAAGAIGASADGEYVYFVASNQLLPGGPAGSAPRIYVWHDGAIREVAALDSKTEVENILGTSGWQQSSQWARITPDGRHLLFLTGGSGAAGVYVYAADGVPGRLQCASCPQDRAAPGSGADFNARSRARILRGNQHLNRAISDDGRFVFFSTAQQLAAEDRNGAEDAYRFDTATGVAQPLTPGGLGVGSYFLEASPSGSDSFVATRSALVASDRDEAVDVYDARVGGGFLEAEEGEPACASEQSCRPPQEEGGGAALPASAGGVFSPPAGRRHRHRARHRKSKHRRHRNSRHPHGRRRGERDG